MAETNPFAAEIERRKSANPFAAEISRRLESPPTVASAENPSFMETLKQNVTQPFSGGLAADQFREGVAGAKDVSRAISQEEGGVRGAISEGLLTPAQMVAAGAAGLPNVLLEQFPAWVSGKLFGGDVVPTSYFPTPQEVQQFITETTGLSQNPAESAPGKVGQAAMAGVMATPGAAVLGGAAGALSETAGQFTEDTKYETISRILGAVAPFGAAAGINAVRPPPSAVILKELNQLNPEQLQSVMGILDDGVRLGSPVTIAEAVSQVTGRAGSGALRGQRAAESVSADPGTPAGRLQDMIAARGDTLDSAGTQRGAVEGVIPDVTRTPSRLASEASDAAGSSIQNQRKITNLITRPLYDRVTESGVVLDQAKLDAVIAKHPVVSDAIDAVKSGKVREAGADTLPNNSPKVLQQAAQRLSSQADEAMTAGNGNNARILGNAAKAINKELGDSFADYAAANRTQATRIARKEAPLKDGPMGAVSNQKKLSTQYRQIFSDPLSASPAQVTRVIEDLTRFGPPGLAEDFVNQYIRSVFDRVGGGEAARQGPKFVNALTANKAAKANLDAALKALPDGEARAKAAADLLRVLDAQGKRLPVGSNTSEKLAEREAMSVGLPEQAVETVSSPLTGIPAYLKEWRFGRNSQEMAEILMLSPDQLRKLRSLSATDEFLRRAAMQISVQGTR